VPRDSPDQAREIGTGLPADSALKRGDLVFLPGHVAIMLDGERAVHASSDPMAVVIEPIAAIAARITAREGAGITGVRRP
jgi:cell wall-associated NlpC family hydrolase